MNAMVLPVKGRGMNLRSQIRDGRERGDHKASEKTAADMIFVVPDTSFENSLPSSTRPSFIALFIAWRFAVLYGTAVTVGFAVVVKLVLTQRSTTSAALVSCVGVGIGFLLLSCGAFEFRAEARHRLSPILWLVIGGVSSSLMALPVMGFPGALAALGVGLSVPSLLALVYGWVGGSVGVIYVTLSVWASTTLLNSNLVQHTATFAALLIPALITNVFAGGLLTWLMRKRCVLAPRLESLFREHAPVPPVQLEHRPHSANDVGDIDRSSNEPQAKETVRLEEAHEEILAFITEHQIKQVEVAILCMIARNDTNHAIRENLFVEKLTNTKWTPGMLENQITGLYLIIPVGGSTADKRRKLSRHLQAKGWHTFPYRAAGNSQR